MLILFIISICTTTVYASPTINKTTLKLWTKESYKLKVNTSEKTTWISRNKAVATVSSKGVVKAIKPGMTTIIAKTKNSIKTCKVTVKNAPVMSGTKSTWIYVKESVQPNINYKRNYKVINTFSNPTWKLSSKKYIEMSQKSNGYVSVSALGPSGGVIGTTILTAKISSDASTRTLRKVIKTKMHPRLNAEYEVYPGKSMSFLITNASSVEGATFSYTNKEAVTIERRYFKFYVKGKKPGKSNLTLKLNHGKIILHTTIVVKEQKAKDYAINVMTKLKSKYPAGTHWGQEKYYSTDDGWTGGTFHGGRGCAAFSFMINQTVYNEVSKRYKDSVQEKCNMISSFDEYKDKISPGDIIRLYAKPLSGDGHEIVVYYTYERNGHKYIVFADGAANDAVRWEVTFTESQLRSNFIYALTRWK